MVDEKIVQLLLPRADQDGYRVSEKYAREMLQKNEGKLVNALLAIKNDIDDRKFPFIASCSSLAMFQGR